MTMDENNKRFREILKRKHEIENAIRVLGAEKDALDAELVDMTGIKVGDTVDQYGEKIHAITVTADVYFLDRFIKGDVPGQVCLQARGRGTPLTKAGAPNKTIRWKSWSKFIADVSMTEDEYFAICPRGTD
jgi:hypothetical protein